jgi:hypothetical protein
MAAKRPVKNKEQQAITVSVGLTRWRPWLEPLGLGTALITLIAIGRTAGIGPRELVLGSIFGVLIFGVFVAARTLPQLKKGRVHTVALVLLGFCVFYFIATSATIFACVFFAKPIDLCHWIDPDCHKRGIDDERFVELPTDLHAMQLDVKPIDKLPEWLYSPSSANDAKARLRTKMGKWVIWTAKGAAIDNGGKLVQASWTGGFPGRHKYAAALRLGDHDRSEYVIMDGILFVIDDSKGKDNVIEIRQFPVNISENAPDKEDPTCEFKDVRRGEKLYLLLRLFPKVPNKKLSQPFCIWFQKT